MAKDPRATFTIRTVDQLTIEGEKSFRHVGLYADLKDVLARAKYPFRVLPEASEGRLDRALLLNLTFWSADSGGDILTRDEIDADVVCHAAWHHLAARAFGGTGEKPSVDSLFLGEAIASAFDVYLVGRLLGHSPDASFLETQVPAMADATDAAGMSEEDFEAMLQSIADDPDRAFEDLRQLLVDATTKLFACRTAEEGYAALTSFDGHRFAALLHRYELSNWVLYARAYAGNQGDDARVRTVDKTLRAHEASLDWLTENWVLPAIA
ncbi:hypothetical protein AKJ09_07294 [Labilithrix luteola]|uniref:Uncharacterized protein n=1 Tax=Labilithrix luteola TaxID=1391654 RepID=A0A0K1Q473_9BACT|nr:hypothetical protein [Labilithrix luteola]AKV00631.1 hypothetical protein AKJ09_07294 [Labilithrix luteola]